MSHSNAAVIAVDQPGRARRFVLGVGLAAAAAAAFVVAGVRRDAGQLGVRSLDFRPARFLIATLLEVSLLGWTVYLWATMLASFDAPAPRFRGMLNIWWRSTLAKYLPGSIWPVAVTAEMATDAGGSPVGLASAFLLQAAFTLVGAVTIAALFAAAAPTWIASAGIVAGIALAHPKMINALVQLGARLAHRDAPVCRGTRLWGATLLLLHVATWTAYGYTFSLLLSSIVDVGGASWTTLAGINAMAFAAGFVAIFAPGGVGVRETALVVLLAPFVPDLGTRVAAAAASRLWLVLTEAVGGALVAGANRTAWRSRAPAHPSPNASRQTPLPASTEHARRGLGIRDARVDVLTDTAAALALITEACASARHSISIAQLAFDAD